MKLMIIGVARSGTTILANYINSLENSFCFIEPHWSMKLHNKIDEFYLPAINDPDHDLFHKEDNLPLDYLISEMENKYNIVGFKETYRKSKDRFRDNTELIQNYIDSNLYTIIYILRHPYAVYNSIKRFDRTPLETKKNFEDFISSYKGFLDLIVANRPVIYEYFIENPFQEILEKTGIAVKNPSKILSHNTRMGDETANKTDEIRKIKSETLITEEDRKIIDSYRFIYFYNQFL